MKIEIKNTTINYIQYGNIKGQDILLLHGWGQNIEMMKFIGDKLQDRYNIAILDLPGFGESSEPDYPWNLDDYKECLELFVKELNIKKPIVMGHSFGGRLAINYASDHDISKLILFGSPIRPEQKNDSLKVRTLKTLKKMPGMNQIGEKMKKYIGSKDYKNASPIMRQILVNTVNTDLTETSKKIEQPTLIIWGDNDTEASIEDAKILEKNIKDAGLIILPGTHYAYIENLNQIINILNNFL